MIKKIGLLTATILVSVSCIVEETGFEVNEIEVKSESNLEATQKLQDVNQAVGFYCITKNLGDLATAEVVRGSLDGFVDRYEQAYRQLEDKDKNGFAVNISRDYEQTCIDAQRGT